MWQEDNKEGSQPQQLFYRLDGGSALPPAAVELPSGVEGGLWSPKGLNIKPKNFAVMPFVVWGLFHHFRVFRNRRYCLFLITAGDKLVHRSCVFPGYFRFPFMASEDLQVGDTWTAEDHRGRGLAAYALSSIVHSLQQPERKFWYICDAQNVASARVAVKAGFRLVGRGVRTKRFGVSLLGSFLMTDPV